MQIWLYVATYIFCQTVKACAHILEYYYCNTHLVCHIYEYCNAVSDNMNVTTHTSYQLVPVSADMSGLS